MIVLSVDVAVFVLDLIMQRMVVKVSVLLFLSAILLVWGCSVPPQSSPPPEKSRQVSTEKKKESPLVRKSKKPIIKKKAKPSEPRPLTQPADEQGLEDVADPAGEMSGQELIVGRMMFHYDYYPDPGVYFDTIRHLYFYNDGGRWIMSVALPVSFQERLGDKVRLKMKNDRPYTLNHEHRVEFPSSTRP